MRIKKATGIVPVTEDLQIKWNVILKATERKLIELLLAESENVIVKIWVEVDNPKNANYPGNVKGEAKRLLDRNKHLEKTLKQRREKKWRKFTDPVD